MVDEWGYEIQLMCPTPMTRKVFFEYNRVILMHWVCCAALLSSLVFVDLPTIPSPSGGTGGKSTATLRRLPEFQCFVKSTSHDTAAGPIQHIDAHNLPLVALQH